MTSKREEIARALFKRDALLSGEMDWEYLDEWDRDQFLGDADAALSALMTPTPAMVEAGAKAHAPGYEYAPAIVSDIFTAMIRAAEGRGE